MYMYINKARVKLPSDETGFLESTCIYWLTYLYSTQLKEFVPSKRSIANYSNESTYVRSYI